MIELDIKDLRKKALIKFSLKPEGHIFGVRKKTPLDDLKMSELNRKRNKLIVDGTKLQEEYSKAEGDSTKLKGLDKKIDAIMVKIEEAEQEEVAIRASIFDDGGDQSLSKALYLELSDDERERLIEAVQNSVDVV